MTRFGGFSQPGTGVLDITTERQILFGYGSINYLAIVDDALIVGGTQDATNTGYPYVLRPGFLLGQVAASGQYAAYNAANTDGTQIARAILAVEVLTQDFSSNNANRVAPIFIAGPVKANQLIGLDSLARSQLAKQFLFDDNYVGNRFAPANVVAKTASYQLLTTDTGTVFVAKGTAALTFTLPAIANGMWFKFVNYVGQNMIVSSTEGSNIIIKNNAGASNLTFSTASNLIGATLEVYSIQIASALYWVAEQTCTNTLTVS